MKRGSRIFRRGRITRVCALGALLGLLLGACGIAQAEPARWWLWQSRVDGRYLCIQTTPGQGWVKVAGPFSSAQCRRYIKQLLIDADPFSRERRSDSGSAVSGGSR